MTIAGTGAAARAEIELHQPDLIILDLILPDEDGVVLCTASSEESGQRADSDQ